ncbi:unnamed protein product [Larinioides sclopetarius]|uniref:Uncharacterized protein n=1 Tax=Larinioides sclopetarius TaxID=280406 RepID=A0AAV1Z1D9_9ARAC
MHLYKKMKLVDSVTEHFTDVTIWNFFLLLLTNIVSADDDNVMPTSNATSDSDPEQSENEEIIFSSPISDDIPEPIGMPKPTKPKSHHHNKQKDHLENVQSHRKPVYEAVSQPCRSYSCRGFDGNYPRWQPRGNRVVPYPQPQPPFNEGRRRGPYQSQDYYFDDYYMPRDPEYGYRQRGGYGYARGRYGGGDIGGYGQPGYGRRFLG